MIIAIYPNGSHVKLTDLDQGYQLPGTFYLFWIDTIYLVNVIKFKHYDKSKNEKNFNFGNFELVGIEKTSNGFVFSIYEDRKNKINNLEIRSVIRLGIEDALGSCIKEIIDASSYPTFEIYESIKEIDKIKNENKLLKDELENNCGIY